MIRLNHIVRSVLMVTAVLCGLYLAIGTVAGSRRQDPTRKAADEDPKDLVLVVMITCKLADGDSFGAGIIFGEGVDRLYIATADHLVRKGIQKAQNLRVQFRWLPGETIEANLLDDYDSLPGLDLAVLAVDLNKINRNSLKSIRWEQLGDPGSLKSGDSLYSIGYLRGIIRRINITPFKFVEKSGDQLHFESNFIGPGSSGGTLLNDKREVVGMVRDSQPPDCRAASIQSVVVKLRKWGYPVNLKNAPPAVEPLQPLPTELPKPTIIITITLIPPFDPDGGDQSSAKIEGEISGVDPKSFRVVLYSYTYRWYVQPTQANPFTKIEQDGKWSANIHTGTKYAALLVSPDFEPPNTTPNLPGVGGKVVAVTIVVGPK